MSDNNSLNLSIYDNVKHIDAYERVKTKAEIKGKAKTDEHGNVINKLAPFKQPKMMPYLPQYTRTIKEAREYFYNNNASDISSQGNYTYEDIKNKKTNRDSLREIPKFVLNKKKYADRADMEAGKTGIASGTPGSQTLVVTGAPIGWRLGDTMAGPMRKATRLNNFNQFPKDFISN